MEAAWGEAVLGALVRALLEWNTAKGAGAGAYAQVCACFVDLNELRVCTHDDLVAALRDHPAASERAARVRACLADVYRREHAMSLAALREAPKREARQYLESLDGVPRAVAARVGLEMLEIHAVPIDDRLRDMLEAEGVIERGTTAEQAAAEVERAIAASDVREAVVLLRAWAEADWQPKASTARVAAKDTKGAKGRTESSGRRGGAGSTKDEPTQNGRGTRARAGKGDVGKGDVGKGGDAKGGDGKSGDGKSGDAKGTSGARKRSGKK